MTARYRCPWCGAAFRDAYATQAHIIGTHRKALTDGLGLIETFGTHSEENPP